MSKQWEVAIHGRDEQVIGADTYEYVPESMSFVFYRDLEIVFQVRDGGLVYIKALDPATTSA